MTVKIDPTKTFKSLLLLILIIVTAGCIVVISKIYFNSYNKFIYEFFDLDHETNLPTCFSTIILFFSAFLLAIISFILKKNDKNYVLWMLLSLCFLFLSLDEFTSIHERIGGFLQKMFMLDGIFYYAWVIPYGIITLVFVLIYFKYFLLKLPKRIRNLFIKSGAIFLLGAIGVEMLGSIAVTTVQPSEILISTLYIIEETLEMIGIAYLIYALLVYLKEELEFTINIKSI